MSEPVIDRLTQRLPGRRLPVRLPGRRRASSTTSTTGCSTRSCSTDSEQPVLIAVAVEASPLATRSLQVPGLLGALVKKYQAKGGYEELWFGKVPVDGSDTAEAAEFRYGGGDPRQVLIVAARIAGPEIVTLQVHFPPSTADENRPLALGIIDSLTVDPGAAAGGSTDERWDVVQPDTAFDADDAT